MKLLNIKPLNDKELKSIGGGESGWYWFVYAAGSAYHYLANLPDRVTPSQGGNATWADK